jgi:hypothetical protein
MTTFENNTDSNNNHAESERTPDDGLSAVDMSGLSSQNKRVAPRYIRDDIIIALCEITPFSFGREVFIDFVKLNDITSRGLSFSTTHHLTTHKKIVLNLIFHSEVAFKISGTIIYRTSTVIYRTQAVVFQYGVKFDSDHNELSEHLLETQSKLVFK